MAKPNKILYSDQRRVLEHVKAFAHSEVKGSGCAKEGYLWGSAADSKFGNYERPWRDEGGEVHAGSDIDVIIVVDEARHLPSHWKFTGVKRSWCEIYKIGTFSYKEKRFSFKSHHHVMEGLLVFPSRHNVKEMHANIDVKAIRIF